MSGPAENSVGPGIVGNSAPEVNEETVLHSYERTLSDARLKRDRSACGNVEEIARSCWQAYRDKGDLRFLNAALKAFDIVTHVSRGREAADMIRPFEGALKSLFTLPSQLQADNRIGRRASQEYTLCGQAVTSLSIVVLSGPRASFTNTLLQSLFSNGIRVKALIIDQKDRLAHRYGEFFHFSLGRGFYERYAAERSPWYQPYGRAPVVLPWNAARNCGVASHRVGSICGDQARALIASHSPDICLLSGVGLIDSALLSIPRVGTLNVHSGILPNYRGLDTVAWSMLEGFPVGCSIHFIDRGVDTGDILATCALSEEQCSTGVKRSLAHVKAGLVLWALDAIAAETFTTMPQALAAGRQYYRIHPTLRAVLACRHNQFGHRAFVGNG